jgi:hypothetical protein
MGKSNLFLFEIDIDIDIESILEHIAWAFFYPFSRCPSTSFLLPLAKANGNKKGFPIAIGTPIGANSTSLGFFLTFGFELHWNSK